MQFQDKIGASVVLGYYAINLEFRDKFSTKL